MSRIFLECDKGLSLQLSVLLLSTNVYYYLIVAGVTLSLSTNIDGKNFGSGGHKIGLAFDLEA